MERSEAPITSVRNARVVEARKLTQRKHRYRQDRFLVEGLQLLGVAVDRMGDAASGGCIRPHELFYCEELFVGETAPRLLGALIEAGASAIHVAPHILDTLSEREVSQGLAGSFGLHALEGSLDELEAASSPSPELIVVLDRLQDPGNLGTLIRTADAVGARAVVLLEPSVDPFDPKTVRGTMGSLFSVPFVRVDDTSVLWSWLDRLGCRVVGADAGVGETVWESRALDGSVALILGNEARGLSEDLRARLTDYVGLPLLGHAESLNVAIAGGILMYEWLRVNRPDAPWQPSPNA
jgi:TrmH family RNA methyltransferase